MSSPTPAARSPRAVALALAVLSCGILAVAEVGPASGATPRRRAAAPAKPRLSAETLVPTELFEEADARRFGYPNGLEVLYTSTETGHHWKLNEPSQAAEPAAPGAADAPPAAAAEHLGATSEEADFIANVALVRPTFVTIVFTDSPAAAQQMVDDQQAARENREELVKTIKLTVNKNDKDSRLGVPALSYNREFNLGEKSGGIRRGAAILLAKGSIFLRVDACGGLRDGSFEMNEDTLETRARAVAAYLLRKM